MKEKLSAILTVGFIFSLFFYYKVINPVENNIDISSVNQNKEILEVEIIEDDNINLIDEIAIDEINDDHCNLDIENTEDFEDPNNDNWGYGNLDGAEGNGAWDCDPLNNNISSCLMIFLR